MLREIIGVGIDFKNRRKDVRIDLRAKLCAFGLAKYDMNTDTVDYGGCRVIETRDIGSCGMCVAHDNSLKKGDLLEFRTRYSLEDKGCIRCPWFQDIVEDLPMRAFIGKVIWRSNSIAGLNFVMMHEKDKTYLRRLASDAFNKK